MRVSYVPSCVSSCVFRHFDSLFLSALVCRFTIFVLFQRHEGYNTAYFLCERTIIKFYPHDFQPFTNVTKSFIKWVEMATRIPVSHTNPLLFLFNYSCFSYIFGLRKKCKI